MAFLDLFEDIYPNCTPIEDRHGFTGENPPPDSCLELSCGRRIYVPNAEPSNDLQMPIFQTLTLKCTRIQKNAQPHSLEFNGLGVIEFKCSVYSKI